MTSLYVSNQIDITTFDLRGREGQNGGQKIQKLHSTYFLTTMYVGDSKPLYTLSFELLGHLRS